jgi:hypothetical protein
MTCALYACVASGGRCHLEPRDKGRLGRLSNSTGRNVSEVRAGPESPNADADPPSFRGRPRERGSNRQMTPASIRRGNGHGTLEG